MTITTTEEITNAIAEMDAIIAKVEADIKETTQMVDYGNEEDAYCWINDLKETISKWEGECEAWNTFWELDKALYAKYDAIFKKYEGEPERLENRLESYDPNDDGDARYDAWKDDQLTN